MFELGDKFDIKSKFNWDNTDENGLSTDSLLDSLLKPVCSDPEMPPKGLYFIGSRTVTTSFGKEIKLKGSNALRWLFGKGHTNYPAGFLNQPYDEPGRLNWLKNSRAQNITGLFQNKVVASMSVNGMDLNSGYYILGIEDDSNSTDSVHFRFWYIDCAEKIKVKKLPWKVPGNGIDLQSTFPGGQNSENVWVRRLEGDVPIVDGTLPGWGTSPDGSVISYIKFGMDAFQRFVTTVNLFKTSDTPLVKRSIEHTLDRSDVEFFFENGELDWEDILDGETNSNINPSKYRWNDYKNNIEDEELDLRRSRVRLKYTVTETWETESGKIITQEAPPAFLWRDCESAKATVGYVTDTDDSGVHRTEFYQFTVRFKVKGLKQEDLEFEEYRHKADPAQKFLNNKIVSD